MTYSGHLTTRARRCHPPILAPLRWPGPFDRLRPWYRRHKIHPKSTMLHDLRASILRRLSGLPSVVPLHPRAPSWRSFCSEPLPPRTPQTGSLSRHRPLATATAHMVFDHHRIDRRRRLPAAWTTPPLSQQWAGPVLFGLAKGWPGGTVYFLFFVGNYLNQIHSSSNLMKFVETSITSRISTNEL
jgi:hypothetical protein